MSSRKSTSRSAAVPTITRSAPAASASRTAAAFRSPPPYCTGTPRALGDPAQVLERPRLALPRPVQVDHVQPPRARLHPRQRGLERIVVVDGLLLVAAVREPHRVPVADVDGRVEDHAATRAQMRVKLRSSASPLREDFSGWNCAPMTVPRSAMDTNGPP